MSINTKQKLDILGCNINPVTMNDALLFIEETIEQGIPAHVITLNAEIVYRAHSDRQLTDLINSASLNTPDGIGIVWAARQLGYELQERVTGIDMLYQLCKMAAKKSWRIFLLGAAPGVAEKAGINLTRKYTGLNIAGIRDGYFNAEEENQIIQDIKQQRPDILFAALGAPRQEYWIRQHLEEMGVPVCIGVGGSFDVAAGIKKRAPGIFIKLNLEWLYRLISEPGRIKRQLALPRFASLILKQKFARRAGE